jgi:hypothetical protein
MPTQTPILKPPAYTNTRSYTRLAEQSVGSSDFDTVKLLIVAAALAALACLVAVGISTAICVYFSPASELNQTVSK